MQTPDVQTSPNGQPCGQPMLGSALPPHALAIHKDKASIVLRLVSTIACCSKRRAAAKGVIRRHARGWVVGLQTAHDQWTSHRSLDRAAAARDSHHGRPSLQD